MLSKEIRNKRQKAKKEMAHAKRIMKEMERYLNCSDERSIGLACAFYQVFAYHIQEGDLEPSNLNLVSLLRRNHGN